MDEMDCVQSLVLMHASANPPYAQDIHSDQDRMLGLAVDVHDVCRGKVP